MPQQGTLTPEQFAKQLGGTVGEAQPTLSPDDFAKQLGGTVGTEDTIGDVGPPMPEHPHARVARIAKDYLGLTPASVGAMVGGARGATMGGAAFGPLGAVGGGLLGAGVGALGGEGLQAGLEQLAQYFGFTPAAQTPPVTAERFTEAAKTGVEGEAVGQALGPVVQKVGQTIAAPVAGKLASYAREALATFPDKVMPAEVSKSRLLNIAQNVSEGSIFGGERVARIKAARQAAAEDQVMRVLDRLGPSVTDKAAGQSVLDARKAGIRGFRADENAAWDVFRKTAEGVEATTPSLDQFIAELQGREAGAILPNAGAEAARRISAMSDITSDMSRLLEDPMYLALPARSQELARDAVMGPAKPGVSVTQLQKTTSDLGKLVRSLTESAKNDPSKYNGQLGLAKKLLSTAREDLEHSLKASPEAEKAYHSAIEVSRLGNETYFNDALKSIVKQEGKAPERITARLMQPNSSTAIEAVRKAVGRDGMQPIQRRALEEIVAPNPHTQQIDWGQVSARLDQMGDDTLSALFPGSHATEIRRLSRLMLNLEGATKAGKGIGRQGIYLTQWGALVGALSGTLPPAAGGVLLTPPLIQRIMTSPTGLKWLTTGLRFPPGTEQAVKSAAMLTAFLRQQSGEPAMAVSHDRQ